MAMRPSEIAPTEMLDRKYSNIAAVASILISLLAAVMLVARIFNIFGDEMSAPVTAYLATWVVLLAVVIAAGAALLRGQSWAQRFSLIYYVVVAGGAVVAGASALMPGGATWWQEESVPIALVLVPVLVGAGVAAVLFVLASVPASRLRYASVVTVTIAVAVTLVVVANLVAHLMAQSQFLRLNMETSGLYGVSQRTRRIAGGLSTPVRLTCAYTAADEEGKKISKKYGPRTLELLEDTADLSDQIEVVNANTDAAKAQVLVRLRGKLGGKADKHIKFLEQFTADSDTISKALAEQAEQWRGTSKATYLDLWGMSVDIARMLNKLGAETEKTHDKINREMGGSGLPDYATLGDDAKASLKETQKSLAQVTQVLAMIAEIPLKVTENRKDAIKKTSECVDAASAMARAIGTPEKPPPSKPSSVLGKFITAARETARKARVAAKALADIGGPKNAGLVRDSRVWQTQLPAGPGIVFRASLSDLYNLLAQKIDQMVLDSEGLIKAAKTDYQADVIVKMRPQVVQIARSFNDTHEKVSAATTALVTVDKETLKIFNQAQNKVLFKDLLTRCDDLLAQADELPKLESSSLTTDITGNNIVIVEAEGKTEVVEFNAVWPHRNQPMGFTGPGDAEQRRIFNGDTAISSKILSLTRKPFATVLLTYYRVMVPPRMQRMVPPAEIDPRQLGTLKKRLEEANFLVKEWNLGQDMPKPAPDEPDTQVMIVLPPPPAMGGPMGGGGMGQFTAQHVNKIRQAVDSGTNAIFLALFIQPRRMSMFGPAVPQPYGLNGYLKEDWGITALTDHLVVPAVADENDTDKFKISGHRFAYLPLNNFSDHAIGKPLRRQRVLWASLCPIRTEATLPEGVTVQPLLSIPGDWRDTWATSRFRELVEQFRSGPGSKVYPEYDKGDLPAPFDVAVAATRTRTSSAADEAQPATTQPATTQAATAPNQQHAEPARIVVLGMGHSFTDGYLSQAVPVQDAKGTVTLTDPPRANADVVINSVYWLAGPESYIAAGPAATQLVLIGQTTRTVLAAIFVVVLPVLVLGAGAAVMVMRRR